VVIISEMVTSLTSVLAHVSPLKEKEKKLDAKDHPRSSDTSTAACV